MMDKSTHDINEYAPQKEVKLVRNERLDKFYTIPTCSKKCIDKISELYDITKWDFIITW
jgi:hypothetical protein